jgi:hypothetical protein
MKKFAILLCAIMLVAFTYAQKVSENEIPLPVKSALLKSYPKAKGVKWEREDGRFEAAFEIEGSKYSLLIDVSGNILETETEIKVSDLPVRAKEYITKKYPGQKIKEAAKIVDSKGFVTYEAELKGRDLIFDSEGKFIK